MLALVGISVESTELDDVSKQLSRLAPIEQHYRAKGESNMFALISVPGVQELRDFLENQILRISAVKSTVTSVLLHSYMGPKGDR